MRRIGALLAAGLIAGSLGLPLWAQESRESLDATPPPVKLKSESTAVMLSVVGGLVPLGLAVLASGSSGHESSALDGFILASMAVGPSLGYFYAGLPGRGLKGVGARAIGLAGLIGGFLFLWDEMDKKPALGVSLALGGGALFLYSTFYDMTTIRTAVRTRNNKYQGVSLNVAPVLAPKSRTVGLSLQLGF